MEKIKKAIIENPSYDILGEKELEIMMKWGLIKDELEEMQFVISKKIHDNVKAFIFVEFPTDLNKNNLKLIPMDYIYSDGDCRIEFGRIKGKIMPYWEGIKSEILNWF